LFSRAMGRNTYRDHSPSCHEPLHHEKVTPRRGENLPGGNQAPKRLGQVGESERRVHFRGAAVLGGEWKGRKRKNQIQTVSGSKLKEKKRAGFSSQKYAKNQTSIMKTKENVADHRSGTGSGKRTIILIAKHQIRVNLQCWVSSKQ